MDLQDKIVESNDKLKIDSTMFQSADSTFEFKKYEDRMTRKRIQIMKNIDTSFNRSKMKTESVFLKRKSVVRRSERLNLQKGKNVVISKTKSRRTSDRLKNRLKLISSDVHVEDHVRVINESTLTIRTRGSPSQLFYLLSNMTPQQRNVVSKIGFSSLLGMKVCVIPSRLGFKAVDFFDEDSMFLNLKSGNIEINRETVNAIMGFPMGEKKIDSIKRVRASNPTIISWRNQFDRYKNSKETNIHVSEVVHKILDNGNTDRMFLLNFFVVVSSCLCLPASGVACQKILSFIPEFEDDIKKLDWCSYLLDCLKDSKKKWNKYDTSGANYYCGPVTFLSLLYAESILKQQKKKRQEGAAIQYWTSDLLYEVQKVDRMLNEDEKEVNANIKGKKGVKSYERSHTFRKIKAASMDDSNKLLKDHVQSEPAKGSVHQCLDKVLDDDFDEINKSIDEVAEFGVENFVLEELFVSPPIKRQRMFRPRKAKELPNGEGQKENPIMV